MNPDLDNSLHDELQLERAARIAVRDLRGGSVRRESGPALDPPAGHQPADFRPVAGQHSSGPNVNVNALRPFKGYTAIRMRLSDATSNYHGMQLYAAKRKGDLLMTVVVHVVQSPDRCERLQRQPGGSVQPQIQLRPCDIRSAPHFRADLHLHGEDVQPHNRFHQSRCSTVMRSAASRACSQARTDSDGNQDNPVVLGNRRADCLGGDGLIPERRTWSKRLGRPDSIRGRARHTPRDLWRLARCWAGRADVGFLPSPTHRANREGSNCNFRLTFSMLSIARTSAIWKAT